MARMPSELPAPSASHPPAPGASASTGCGLAARELAQASRALWLATLGLMTAFMQTPAPAHRLLLARRIARNFDTLRAQDCFDAGCRASFTRLAQRWHARAQQLAPERQDSRGGLLRLLS